MMPEDDDARMRRDDDDDAHRLALVELQCLSRGPGCRPRDDSRGPGCQTTRAAPLEDDDDDAHRC